ncbi:acyl-CoA thioesterase [Micromonospora pattaloongensis]|uniref:acyl-CoA thioesterase n=1 Tax=Micromonospora pattaloongensis TaxID=405436 RepID=UPI000B82CF58|nr:thioesterase family protein [Micromonospora pattaloongensis]
MADHRYVYHCALRWSDLDAYGHVNNARFLTLYEEARVALMFVGGRAWGVGSFSDGVVIARHEIDYLRPVDYALGRATAETPPQVRIEMWVEQIRASRFTIGYELFDGDVLASRARSVLVPFDLEQQRPRRLTGDERTFLARYAAPAEGAADSAAGEPLPAEVRSR